MKKSDQIFSAKFLEKYGGLAIYDEDLKKRYTIDHEDINFFKKKGCNLIGPPDEPDGSYIDHEYFYINEDFSIELFPNTIMKV